MAGRVVLEREVLDPERGSEAGSPKERRAARASSHRGLAIEGQQLVVAPEVGRTSRDGLTREGSLHRVQVVDRLESAPAFLAGRHRILGACAPAFFALEARYKAHHIPQKPERPLGLRLGAFVWSLARLRSSGRTSRPRG